MKTLIANGTKAFLTGSTVYGNVHAKSDVDLVIRIDEAEAAELVAALGSSCQYDTEYGRDAAAIRIGRLNIILAKTDERYGSCGTQVLKRLREDDEVPVQRSLAVALFRALFEAEASYPTEPEGDAQVLSREGR